MSRKNIKSLLSITLVLALLLTSNSLMVFADKSKDGNERVKVPEGIEMILNGEDFVFGEGAKLHKVDDGSADAQFKSGGTDHTHQYIVANALQILKNDKGWSVLNDEAYTLLTNTDWPDVVGNETDYMTFSGHFYNPYTGKNWLGLTSPTAYARAVNYYNDAVTLYKSGDIDGAMEKLGRGTHYVSDINEPHHAANLTDITANHSDFESYVDDNRTSFYVYLNTLNSTKYSSAASSSVGTLVYNAAVKAYALSTDAQNVDKYYSTAKSCVQNAITNQALYLYKFGKAVGIY